MGGPGSGNRYRSRPRKVTVEESAVLTVKALRTRLALAAVGSLPLPHVIGGPPSIGYFITPTDPTDVVLHYPRHGAYMWLRARLVATPARYGGQRWWVACPFTAKGVACNRRVGKLYLPPRAHQFGCRKCHTLAYKSSQDAHKAERCFTGMGFDPELVRFMAGRWDRKLAQ